VTPAEYWNRVTNLFSPESVLRSALALALSAALSVVLTYLVRQRARRAGLFDRADARKLHATEIPRIGGVAIVASVALTLAVLAGVIGANAFLEHGSGLLVVLGGALAIHILGLYDDLWQVRARWKFLAQILIALAVYILGVRMTTLSLPFIGIVNLPFAISLAFTVLWFVGITNAFNLIDGLDGLAAGAALFALMTMFVVASANGRSGAALVTLVLAGATLGFLYYNFHPATIFLGDSGSLFLGFMLAGIGVLSAQKSPTVIAVAIPVVSLGLPVLDTSLAILRRFLRRQPIFSADRGHIHHRLLGAGRSPRSVVLTLYAACAVLALCGMLLVNEGGHVAFVLALIGVGVLFTVQRLKIYEFEEVARLLRIGARQRHTIARGVRVREASARLADLSDLGEVFDALERLFAEDGCPRAELQLAAAFVQEPQDLVLWSWCRDAHVDSTWWSVTLPLLDARGRRMGTLQFWQEGALTKSALPHFHTIAGELRSQIEFKVLTLWRTVPRTRRPTGERERVPTGSGPRVA
jgi:UDP-GlcNAc:undecaprenyl-phosphate GlcNAc-1-phosphate transferase